MSWSSRQVAAGSQGVLAAVLIVGGLAAACGGPGEVPARHLERLIPEDPQEVLDLADFSLPIEAFRWSFASSQELEDWQIEGLEPGWQFRFGAMVSISHSTEQARLVRQVDFDAAEVDRLEIGLSGLRSSRVRLLWAGPGQELDSRRSISLRAREGVGETGRRVFYFDLAQDVAWRGRIRQLAIEQTAMPGQQTRLRQLVAWRYQLAGEGLAELISRPRKVNRVGELRNAWLVVPDIPLRHSLTVAAGAKLRFAFSAPTSWLQRVIYTVSASFEGQETVLFEGRVGPAQKGKWQDHEVDLAAWEGRQIELLFVASPTQPVDPRHGLPAWGHPEIYTASRPGQRIKNARGTERTVPPNVVLISIDTLRADHLSLYGYPRQTTPNIDRWARRRGVTFEQVVAAAPWTLPAHISMLSGLNPLNHGVNHKRSAPLSLRLLAETLRDAGYATVAITGGGFLHPRFGFAQGFDRYRYAFGTAKPENRLTSSLEEALEWLPRLAERRPFLLFFHTYEVHDPYRARQPYFRQFGGPEGMEKVEVVPEPLPERADDGWMARRQFVHRLDSKERPLNFAADSDLVQTFYDSGLAYTDAAIGRLLERLDQLGLSESTVVVLTSDHGEALGEHSSAGHGNLYDDNLMVPLVIATPNLERGSARVERQVRQIDLAPTLIELAGLELPPADGRSLVPLLMGDPAGQRHPRRAISYNGLNNLGLAVRDGGRFKYIFGDSPWPESSRREEVYRLAGDASELNNLAPTEAGLAALREEVTGLLESSYRGLAVELRNAGPGLLSGVLNSRAVSLMAVKTTSLSDSVRWRDGRLRFTLESGERLTLWLPRAVEPIVMRGSLKIEGQRRGHFAIETSPAELASRPLRLAIEGRQVRTLAAEEAAPEHGIELSWRGEVNDPGPEPSTVDPELRARLQALGYLD